MALAEKNYRKWMGIKSKIHNSHLSKNKAHHTRVRAGEIYWASLGENIGHEQDGKGTTFTRPVLIFKRFSENTILVLPLSTNGKNDLFHCRFTIGTTLSSAILSQARSVDTARLGGQIGKISRLEFRALQAKFFSLLY